MLYQSFVGRLIRTERILSYKMNQRNREDMDVGVGRRTVPENVNKSRINAMGMAISFCLADCVADLVEWQFSTLCIPALFLIFES
jgi:hypothetical protein